MKALAVVLFLIALVIAGALAVVVQPLAGKGPPWTGPHADVARLESTVRGLIALGPRNDVAGMTRAADFLVAQLAALGLTPAGQDYRFDNATYRNVIVRLGPGTGPRSVIGAHYDARGPFPGADDNASGAAGLLELARLLKESPPLVRTELVFYPREEVDGMGSEQHALSLQQDEVRAMISLEMIGCFSGPQKFPLPQLRWLYPAEGDYIVVVGRPQDFALVRAVKRAIKGTGLAVESFDGPEKIRGIGNSDHRNYWRRGMTAAMVTDTAWYRNPRYHTAQDTAETLDYARMALVVEGVAAWLSSLPR